MKKIKIKIQEGSCGSGKRDFPLSGGCGDIGPMKYKNVHNKFSIIPAIARMAIVANINNKNKSITSNCGCIMYIITYF